MKTKDVTVETMREVAHPLDPLTAAELRTAVDTLRSAQGLDERHRLAIVRLAEPAKDVVKAFRAGDAIERTAFAVVFDRETGTTHEALVDVVAGEVRSWIEMPGVQPSVTLDEFGEAIAAVRAHDGFRAALAKRGIDDPELVHIEAWSIGDMAPAGLEGRRGRGARPPR